MCRLFGFHSVLKAKVHQSLIAAENALMIQSQAHPDGWGIGYYFQGYPHVLKNLAAANKDDVFKRLAESLASHTVIAHVRRATQGQISLINCHPFQFGHWVMAHNGDCPEFMNLRPYFLEHVEKELSGYIFGTTDSEVYFAIILSELIRLSALGKKIVPLKETTLAVRRAVEKIWNIYEKNQIKSTPMLNLVLSNGTSLLGYKDGKELSYSSFKRSCVAADKCSYFQDSCVNPVKKDKDKISHLLICSEPLIGENVWYDFKEKQIVGIDHDHRFYRNL